MSLEGESQGEMGTALLGLGVMGPAMGEGVAQGSVPVPMTLMYTPYQQPQVQPGFGLRVPHRPISPRGDGLGASPINPSGCPRFPMYTVGHPCLASQQSPAGFNPWTPWGPPMGSPRGPPPGFPPKYSEVMATRGEWVYSPPGSDARYGNGERFPTGNWVIPNQSLNAFPGMEVVVPGETEGNPPSPDNDSQVSNVPETNDGDHAMPDENEVPKESELRSGGAIADTNAIPEGQGQGGMMPNNGDPDNLNDPNNGDPDNLNDPNNGDPENLDDPNNEASPDDPKAEIEALQQQLAQAQEALAKSTKTLQKHAAQDSQINNLRELVQKQQGEFNAQILQYQAREKEQEEASYQAGLDRQKLWEQERQKEKAEWVERQRVWEQERKRQQAKWEAKEKA